MHFSSTREDIDLFRSLRLDVDDNNNPALENTLELVNVATALNQNNTNELKEA